MEIIRRRDFEPPYGPIGKEVALRSYLKPLNLSYIHQTNSTKIETWEELCYRVAVGNANFVPGSLEPGELQKVYDNLLEMKLLPGGRHLSNTGIRGREYIGNCYTSGWDWVCPERHFCFLFGRLMEGGGVGANYSDKYFLNAPQVNSLTVYFKCDKSHRDYRDMEKIGLTEAPNGSPTFVIRDSKEGWVEALSVLLRHVFGCCPPHSGISFDFSNIRPERSPMKTSGGFASGPAALLSAMQKIRSVLLALRNKPLNWKAVMEIDHALSTCVMVGGCRRSARMSCKHWRDPEILDFIKIKNGGQDHWTTNISVLIDSEYLAKVARGDAFVCEIHSEIARSVHINGEPGVANVDVFSKGEDKEELYSLNACFTGDSELFLKDCPVPIGLLDGDSVQIKHPDGGVVDARVSASGTKPVVELVLTRNWRIRCTEDHVFRTREGNEVQARDLVGHSIDIPKFPQRLSLSGDALQLFAAGFIQGDGGTGRLSSAPHKGLEINIGQKDKDVADLLGLEVVGRTVYTRQFVQICRDLGMSAARLPDRTLPERISALSLEGLAAFLCGLYSANGSVSARHHRVTLRSACEELLIGVGGHLQRAFGIDSYITSHSEQEINFPNGLSTSKASYELNISRTCDVIKFSQYINFAQEYKRRRLEEACQSICTKIKRVRPVGQEPVFDFQVKGGTPWGIVSGVVAHNCAEFAMNAYEFCNTGHVNMAFTSTKLELMELLCLMTRFQMRANFCDLPAETREVTDEVQRIGVGFLGLQQFACGMGIRYSEISSNAYMKDLFRSMYKLVRNTARDYSWYLGVNEPRKVTTVAPTGTVGQLCGVSTGCQAIIYKYYLRRVRYHISDPVLHRYADAGYTIEPDSREPENGRVVVIPCKDPLLGSAPESLVEDQTDITAKQALDLQVMLQSLWADNSISFTVNFQRANTSEEDIRELLLHYPKFLKGTTLFPEEHNFEQPPYTRIDHDTYLKCIQSLGRIVHPSVSAEEKCINGVCELL